MINFDFKKSLGQNFLIDENIIDKIVKSSDIDKDTLVIEIGPGAGALSKKTIPLSGYTILYEIDARLKDILGEALKDFDNYEIIFNDVLKQDIKYSKLLLNCIIRKLLGERENFQEPTTYVQRAILYLTENFGGDITLSSTAKHVNISPVYLSKILKKELNVTFSDYLDEMRFSYAQNLLASTDLSILEICYLAGFKDYANFTRRFKKSFCMTPSAYRRMKKGK